MPNNLNIDLWFWRFDEPAQRVARWRSYLDQVETARMERFMFARDQVRFTVCRSRMRRVLGWYTGRPPRDIRFGTMGRDKPVLAPGSGTSLAFNLTHTGGLDDGLACLAVTQEHAVGVDLELIRPVKDDFIAYALNPAEQALVLPLDPDARQRAFFRIWTAKEAYLKAIGTGLWQSLETFDVDMPLESRAGEFRLGTLPRVDDAEQREQDWRVYTFTASDEHTGALAIAVPEQQEVVIRTRWIGSKVPV